MKKSILIILACLTVIASQAQLTWTPKSGMPNFGRYAATGFEIDGKLFVGFGKLTDGSYANDLWEYNPSNDVWTEKKSFPSVGRYAPTSFVIGNKGYICLGLNKSGSYSKTCYSYNPVNDTWVRIADFPGDLRYSAESFVLGDTAFITCGSGGGPTFFKEDLWMYVPSTNKWTRKADFPGGKRNNLVAFALNGYGYVGAGNTSSKVEKTFWKYDKKKNNWSSIASMPVARVVATDFLYKNKCFVGLGRPNSSGSYSSGFYSYSAKTDKWSKGIPNSPNITLRAGSIGFSVDSNVYLACGLSVQGYMTSLHKLNIDTCLFSDTTKITTYDTITTLVFDTIIIVQHDTITTQVFDTVRTFDTTIIIKYDTLTTQILDTTITQIFDTTIITIYDTITTQRFDTTFYTKYDTVVINKLQSVTDTLRIVLNENGVGCILSLKIYPNPAKNKVYLHSSRDNCYPDAKVELIDVLGQVLQTKPNSKLVSFDIRGYSRALYFIRLVDSNGETIFTKKILIE